jgi:hypothetical protein
MSVVEDTILKIREGGYLDRADALEHLVEERDRLLQEAVEFRTRLQDEKQRVEAAEQRISEESLMAHREFVNKARDAFRVYGQHKDRCAFVTQNEFREAGDHGPLGRPNTVPCDCGYDRIFGELV